MDKEKMIDIALMVFFVLFIGHISLFSIFMNNFVIVIPAFIIFSLSMIVLKRMKKYSVVSAIGMMLPLLALAVINMFMRNLGKQFGIDLAIYSFSSMMLPLILSIMVGVGVYFLYKKVKEMNFFTSNQQMIEKSCLIASISLFAFSMLLTLI